MSIIAPLAILLLCTTITQLLASKVLLEDGWHMMTIPSIHPSAKPLNHLNRPQIDLSQPPINSVELRRARAERQKDERTKRRKDKKREGSLTLNTNVHKCTGSFSLYF